jgi:hypothetical protein
MNGKRGIPKGRGLFSFIDLGDNCKISNVVIQSEIRNKK